MNLRSLRIGMRLPGLAKHREESALVQGAIYPDFPRGRVGFDAGLRVAELQAMAQTLEHLADHCHGNERPDCPIIADLAEPAAAAVAEQQSQAPHRTPRFGVDMPASSRHRAAR